MAARGRLSTGEKAFRMGNHFFLLLLAVFTLYPFWFIIQASFTDPIYRFSYLWPKGFYYANYWLVFTTEGVGLAYLVTVLRVSVAVPLMIAVTGAAAFALTRKGLKGRKGITFYYFITMFISGGLIPYYMLLKAVGLLDTFWVYVFPSVFSVWTMIVMKTSFQGLPEGLVEAALIDGAGYARIFLRIIIPLSIPMLVTLALFSAVWHWNDFFVGSFYIKNPKLRPLQTFLRDSMLVQGTTSSNRAHILADDAREGAGFYSQDPRVVAQLLRITSESMKLAYVTVATVPILLVYPFVQRFFMKGVLIGSIKE